jgi:hypothetical protein
MYGDKSSLKTKAGAACLMADRKVNWAAALK